MAILRWLKKNPLVMLLIGAIGMKILRDQMKDAMNVLGAPVSHMKIRDDRMGSGYYGASRGSRSHKGIDLLLSGAGQGIKAPFDGKFSREADPYSSDGNYDGVKLVGTGKYEGLAVKLFYCKEDLNVGDTFKRGQRIATSQDISLKYGNGMQPHLHVEVYENGTRVDPTPYFGLT